MGTIDIRLEATEEEYAFLRWQAVKASTTVAGYIKRLIAEARKQKNTPPMPESTASHV
jgi:hypothetical protein